MHKVKCPNCGERNNLTESDLGVELNCGSCGEPFTFGADIVAERKKVSAERTRQEREEKARVDEESRRAARAARELAETERLRAAAEHQAKAREQAAQAAAMQYAATTPARSRQKPLSSFSFDFVVSVIVLVGTLSIIASILLIVLAIIAAAVGGPVVAIPMVIWAVSTFISGTVTIAFAHCMKLLQAIERNTSRIP